MASIFTPFTGAVHDTAKALHDGKIASKLAGLVERRSHVPSSSGIVDDMLEVAGRSDRSNASPNAKRRRQTSSSQPLAS